MRNPQTGRSAGMMLVALAGTGLLAAPAAANDPDRIAQLEDRIAQLEARPSGGLNLPGNTTLTFYGYAKGDLAFDFDHQLGDTAFGIVGINAGDPERSGSTLHARQSRLGFTTVTQTGLGEVRTLVEGDFFGTGNAFRLRHAYGEFNGFLVGQTWNLFMPIESYPGTLDFQGPAGLPFARVNQLRYTYDGVEDFTIAASVERDPAGYRNPIFTGAVSYDFDTAFVKLAALHRQVDQPGGGTTSGWGVNLSGNAQLWQGGGINASYTEGEGIGSIMVFGGGAAGADIMGAAQGYQAVRTRGIALGVTQDITDTIGVGLVFGERSNRANPNAAPTDTEKLRTVHATLTWKPVEKVTTGVELIYSDRRQYDGAKVDNTRLQFSTQFSF